MDTSKIDEKVLREYLFKEVEITQDVIDRMGTNSFVIKGWAITLVVASLIFGGASYYHFIAFLPWLMFWYLDAYFLRLERLYRKSYGWLILNRLTSPEHLLDMDRTNLERRFGKDIKSLLRVMFSMTLIVFYGLLLVTIVAVVVAGLLLPASSISKA